VDETDGGSATRRTGYKWHLQIAAEKSTTLKFCDNSSPITNNFQKKNYTPIVLFCSLAVFDPRVGHAMDVHVLSPFIPVLCHSD